MKRVKEGKQFNLKTLEGVYDVTLHKASPQARKQRWAKKSAPQPAKADSQQYDDARERAKYYGFDPDRALPIGFFE